MAWELKRVEDQRKSLIERYMSGIESMTDLCKIFNVSRKTAYKWVKRYLEKGPEEGLLDLPKAPQNPYRIYDDHIINLIIDQKLKHRTWGPKKILAKIKRHFPNMKLPCATRAYEILKRHHLVTPRRIRGRVPATHPLGEINASNDTWTADFKGWFLTKDKTKCEPLTMSDGYSRYLLKCEVLPGKSAEYVWPVYEEAFREYGLPRRIRTDNGPPFGSKGVGRLTKVGVNLIKAGVTPEWINPGHPEENGRHERMHSTLKAHVANPPAEDLLGQIDAIKAFQEEYNYERPHEALEMKTPSDYYTRSAREWDGILRSPEYDRTKLQVRKVCQSGCIWVKQKEHYIGTTLVGEYVGLEEVEDDKLKVYFGPVFLGKLDHVSGLEKPKLAKKPVVRRG